MAGTRGLHAAISKTVRSQRHQFLIGVRSCGSQFNLAARTTGFGLHLKTHGIYTYRSPLNFLDRMG